MESKALEKSTNNIAVLSFFARTPSRIRRIVKIWDIVDLISFDNELSSLVRSIPKHNVLVIGGDINAQIVKT